MTIAWSGRVKRIVVGAVAFVALAGFMPAAQTRTVKIQTVSFKSVTLPVWVDITPQISGGLSFDVYMANGACTQNPATQAGYVRLTFQTQLPYSQGITAYGKYCFFANAWDMQTGTLLPATVYTTVNVTP